jgi:hypothetical protein
MTNTHYKKALNRAQQHMRADEKILAKIFHQPVVYLILNTLERSVFRIIPMQFGLISSVTVGLLIISVAYFYGYQINSLSVLGSVFVLGYIIGFVYEYVRVFIRQGK